MPVEPDASGTQQASAQPDRYPGPESPTPGFMPPEAPQRPTDQLQHDLESEAIRANMSEPAAQQSSTTPSTAAAAASPSAKEEVGLPPEETVPKSESKTGAAVPENATKKPHCKKPVSKHATAKNKAATRPSTAGNTRPKPKSSNLKRRIRRKIRAHKEDDYSDTESYESSDDESSSLDEKARKKAAKKRKAKKKAAKKLRSKEYSSDDSEEDEEEEEDAASEERAILRAKRLASRLRERRARLHARGKGSSLKRISSDSQSDGLKVSGHKNKSKKKRASKVAFKRVDEQTRDDPGANEFDQYIFTVRRKFDWENKYQETVVDIKSKPLRDALAKVMDGVKGVSLVQETPVVDPNMLFLYLEETRAYMKELKKLASTEKKKRARKLAATKAAHLKVLVKYLDTDYAETKKTLYPLLESNMITFDLLWALFKPNTIAYTSTYGNADEPRAFKIEYVSKESSFMKGQWYVIEGRYLEYDGKSFGMGTMAAEVESFKGARKITSLACYPLKYHREADELRAKLIERGKKFVALRGMNYRFHKGMAFFKKKRSIIKVNINGRVMIDPALHRRINPNYPISTVRPKDPDILNSSSDEDDSDVGGCCGGGSDSGTDRGNLSHGESERTRPRYKVVRDKKGKAHVVEIEVDDNGNEIQKEDIDKIDSDAKDDVSEPEFSEEELLIASPVVLGFAFSEKLWLEFTVSGITEIEWNEGAFDSLVLPDNQKSIVRALVESHTFHAAQNIDDVIQGKGKGLVAVLHGPPGTGKTLTAEGIAELLKRPLYMVSAGELGTDSRTLEGELNKILDIAHSWGAVLLLDEADVFLEKRTIQDIHRNALVSIFLRLLEYFQGILFLTTNRVETFDDAFQSRIHIALRYGDLTTKAKRSVWKMFLDKVRSIDGVETATFTDKDLDALARHNLNGRQIKNSVRTAQALAVNEKTALSMSHIKRVLEVAETFDHDLRGGTGYMDAMRSYT
ncbi:AAA family ATPase [Rasamsonia emersonii CBS 393.64]|uniref:AAA family ATPase n=1 Tax=Rasamsonia emersonii (strain ATCC 16479 / CBS 393.64 / IMI 116815) TaxID=1408163 RepID=A0A0F4Z0V4_RASE3|nr:AAA family ATPase [Rasamsonia emersonii CBS 393.64]KKA23716.1 AAA family ATPase [Rasamsonia emersonii CBS 393.64]